LEHIGALAFSFQLLLEIAPLPIGFLEPFPQVGDLTAQVIHQLARLRVLLCCVFCCVTRCCVTRRLRWWGLCADWFPVREVDSPERANFLGCKFPTPYARTDRFLADAKQLGRRCDVDSCVMRHVGCVV